MRGKQAPKRKIKPDVKYHRLDIARFVVNKLPKEKLSRMSNIIVWILPD